MQQSETMFHLHCKAEDIGKYVLLTGDPGRTEKIARYLENPRQTSQNREYNIWTGTLNGVPVSVASTGIGGPSAAICMEELVLCGAHTFIRIGTCGGMQADVPAGQLVIPTGVVRMEGTSHEYMPAAFPAVPDFSLTRMLADSAEELDKKYVTGVVQCKDSFYGQHSPERMPIAQRLINDWNAWIAAGVLASEMESAALFVIASVLHVRCATVLNMIWNQEREKKYGITPQPDMDMNAAIKVAVEAMRKAIQADLK
ncbi:MAG: uridine phosphorylase [Ruminococcus sp.]|nr:uridine phosphorylase [Ruminococcus sp.]